MQKTIQYIRAELQNLYPPEEIQAFIYLIFENIFQYSKTDLILKAHTKVNEKSFLQILKIVERLKAFEPLQYILGETEFFGMKFKVNPHVLIPRPETEELVNFVINENTTNSPKKIIDIGTGSGCIAITLAQHLPKCFVWASDISLQALQTAQTNAQLNHVKIRFLQDDILNTRINQAFDIIVSNPPYVTQRQKSQMQANVLNYEPHTALFVPEDEPLLFYQAIAKFALNNLTSGGKIYLEINEELGKPSRDLFLNHNYKNVKIHQDINGKDRIITAIK